MIRMESFKRYKDGSIDFSHVSSRKYFSQHAAIPDELLNIRSKYYEKQLNNPAFRSIIRWIKDYNVEMPVHTLNLSPKHTLAADIRALNYGCFDESSLCCISHDSLKLDMESILREGSFAKISVSTIRAIKRDVVIKIDKKFDPKSYSEDNLLRKRSVLRELIIHSALNNHENIVTMLGYEPNMMILVLEYIEVGDLHHLLYRCETQYAIALLDGRVKKRILIGILNGLEYMHKNYIAHGDIKPHNVLVTEDFTAKITDFGISALISSCDDVESDYTNTRVQGTAGYMAPELLYSEDSDHTSISIDTCTDIYSFGILTNEIIQEEVPYYEMLHRFYSNGELGVDYIMQGNRPTMNNVKVCAELSNLICSCWDTDRAIRPNTEAIRMTLEQVDLDIPSTFIE